MARRLKFYLIGLALGLIVYFLFLKKEQPATATAPPAATAQADLAAARFELKNIGTDDEPLTVVSIATGGRAIAIDTTNRADIFEKSGFAEHEIPADAISACGGWWAGGGDYYYALLTGDRLKIFHGWQEEGQDDKGYHYQEVRSLGAGDWK